MQFNSSPDAVLRRLPRADSCYFPSISLTIQGRAAWFTLMLVKTSARWGERAQCTVWTGLMKDFPSDPSSLVHQKWDLLCLLAARQRALYTEIKNLSSAVTATNQDEPKALCSDHIYMTNYCVPWKSQIIKSSGIDHVFRDESNFMHQTHFLHILEHISIVIKTLMCVRQLFCLGHGCTSLSRWFACFLY